ncbi:MAG TPA: hypothetical protein VGH90_00985 [Chthoniobacteraceae bacterium]|jgi:streptogramin lyase
MTKSLFAAFFLSQALLSFLSAAEVKTIAGNGMKGFSGDGGPATEAQFDEPSGVTLGPDGAVYVCDTNNMRIRKIGTDGIVTTVAGNGKKAFSGDGGPATEASLYEPFEVRFGPDGLMYFVERLNNVVRCVDPKTGIISTVAGVGGAPGFSGDGGPAKEAHFHEPHSIAIDKDGNLFICDIANRRIRKIDVKTGLVSAFAGSGQRGAPADGADFATAPLNGPRAIDFDPAGNLWVALREGNTIFQLDLFSGALHHKAGTGKSGFTGNGGPALEATLSSPKGITVGADGTVFFADTESHSIRKISPDGATVDVLVGTGAKGDGPDGDPLACKLSRPHGVFAQLDGALLIGDTENHRIRIWRP